MTSPAAFVPRRILVDDTSSLITYSSGWTEDADTEVKIDIYGSAFNKTIHKTGGAGTYSLSFDFRGTRLDVIGISLGAPQNQAQDPSLTCSMDQKTFANSSAATNIDLTEHWVYCTASDLADGNHAFTLNVASNGLPARFDYVLYVPSADVPLDNATICIDSTDSSIQYSGNDWSDLKGIVNMTQITGGKVMFDFIGKSLQWYGHVPSELPFAPASGSFAIDGGTPQNFTLQGLVGTTPQSKYDQLFFETPDLIPGLHRLEVTYWGNSATTPLSLDYLLVRNATFTNSSNSTTSASPTTSVSPGVATQSPGPSGGLSNGALAGIIVPTIFAVGFAVFFLFFFVLRRRRGGTRSSDRASARSVLGPEIGPGYPASPFVTPPRWSATDALVSSPEQQVMTQVDPAVGRGGFGRSGLSAGSNPVIPPDPPSMPTVPVAIQTVRHQDSGEKMNVLNEESANHKAEIVQSLSPQLGMLSVGQFLVCFSIFGSKEPDRSEEERANDIVFQMLERKLLATYDDVIDEWPHQY
ncbi:hypothetical protein BDN72DRAFT_859746 [Pluteus cervinus]|uniref:Uncharacterized protein n=1 Tax=Pluteus cervinus TaxID=181527 RepID=A0ACD3ALT2_9AGAR|nr:hypothetical protein BDN72DRAFT_859746 [Pluteus cervinus]